VALAFAGTAYTSVVAREAPVHGPRAAHAAATATVIPWLGVAGAVVALLALVLMPGGGLRRDPATRDRTPAEAQPEPV
jgi:hypothetical protein